MGQPGIIEPYPCPWSGSESSSPRYQSTWVNPVPANLKTMINGGYKGFKFGNYARHHLGAFAYHVNARFDLRELLHNLLGHAAAASPTHERQIRGGTEVHDQSGDNQSAGRMPQSGPAERFFWPRFELANERDSSIPGFASGSLQAAPEVPRCSSRPTHRVSRKEKSKSIRRLGA